MHNPFSLHEKTILVTGASSGIGRQIVLECARMGATVHAVARSADKLATLRDKAPESIYIHTADLTSDDQIEALVPEVPLLDGLVNCAGLMRSLPYRYTTRKLIDELFGINFTAPTLLTKSLLAGKKIKKESSLVFVSSIGGSIIGTNGIAVYGATKGALSASARVLALELAPRKIRVNIISPGMVETPLWNNESSELSKEQIDADRLRYPLGYGQPADVAYAAVYLLSDAARWATGSNLIIDGGISINP